MGMSDGARKGVRIFLNLGLTTTWDGAVAIQALDWRNAHWLLPLVWPGAVCHKTDCTIQFGTVKMGSGTGDNTLLYHTPKAKIVFYTQARVCQVFLFVTLIFFFRLGVGVRLPCNFPGGSNVANLKTRSLVRLLLAVCLVGSSIRGPSSQQMSPLSSRNDTPSFFFFFFRRHFPWPLLPTCPISPGWHQNIRVGR